MTRDYKIPDRQPQTGFSNANQESRLPNLPPIPPRPHTPQPPLAAQPVRDVVKRPALEPPRPVPPAPPRRIKQQRSSYSAQVKTVPKPAAPPAPGTEQAFQEPKQKSRKLPKLLRSWRFWAISSVSVSGIVGLWALAMLLQLPALPNCPAIFWPLASASLRLSCAQLAANKQTMKDLLEAIELVNGLPPDHPLRPEVDRLTEQWSQDILRLAEDTFQEGKLNEAIAAVRKIPYNVQAYSKVEERVQGWQKIWSEAEAIYRQSEDKLREENYGEAFNVAVRLLSVGNAYWETTKYNELTKLIAIAREDGNKLVKANRLAEYNTLNDLLEAIKLAESIRPESHIYQKARSAISKFGRKMLDLAEASLDRRDYQGAVNIARKIPDSAGLKEEARDFLNLAQAHSYAWKGTVSDIEQAIAQAQRIKPGRPLHRKAEQLIARWKVEIGDVTRLAQARDLATPGTVEALSAAIAEASTIAQGNPRWEEAQREVSRWTKQIQTIEDQPVLDQATALASAGDIISLQAAIEEARQVGKNRALYSEAQKKIQDWTDQVQRIQDQPYLDQARDLAEGGDLMSAIAVAQKISPGRALYEEAQADLRGWRNQVEGQQRLNEAYRLANNSGSADNLVKAIAVAQKVPTSSGSRAEADVVIRQWSDQILDSARAQAAYDLPGAIATAQKVPPRTEAYAEAQLQIQTWKGQLTQQGAVQEP
jgi:hypothetical protein